MATESFDKRFVLDEAGAEQLLAMLDAVERGDVQPLRVDRTLTNAEARARSLEVLRRGRFILC